MRLSNKKIEDLIQSILGNYIGTGIEPGFLNNLHRNIYYVLDHGTYAIENGRFYGEVDGKVKLLVVVGTDKIEYKKQTISKDKKEIENTDNVKFKSLKDGGCFVEYNSKIINIIPNTLDNRKTIVFDSYEQKNTKKAFILDMDNNLKVNYVESIKYNYNKNKMDDQITMTTTDKNKNYSEKIYSYDINDTYSARHIIKTYLYPEEILEYSGLTNNDEFVIVNKESGNVSFNPTKNEIAIYAELEERLNNLMYPKKQKTKVKTKKNSN